MVIVLLSKMMFLLAMEWFVKAYFTLAYSLLYVSESSRVFSISPPYHPLHIPYCRFVSPLIHHTFFMHCKSDQIVASMWSRC